MIPGGFEIELTFNYSAVKRQKPKMVYSYRRRLRKSLSGDGFSKLDTQFPLVSAKKKAREAPR